MFVLIVWMVIFHGMYGYQENDICFDCFINYMVWYGFVSWFCNHENPHLLKPPIWWCPMVLLFFFNYTLI